MRGVLLLIGEYILKMNHPDHFEFSFSVVTSTPHLSIITILYVVFKPNESTFEKVHFTSRLIRLSMWLSWQSNCFWHQRPLVQIQSSANFTFVLSTYFVGEISLYVSPHVLPDWIQSNKFCKFLCSNATQYKAVQLNVSHTVMLPL